MTKSQPKTSLDGKCKFYEKKHEYKVGKRKLISATTLLKMFFSEFDASAIAKKMVYLAKARHLANGTELGEEGKVSYWKKQWKESSLHGTRVHHLIEQFMLGRAQDIALTTGGYEQRDINKYNQAKQWLIKFMDTRRSARINPEFILYDDKIGVAGQIDLLLTDNEHITIVDYKTNSKIDQSGYKGKKAKFPIDTIDDCKLEQYSLQLSLYAYILEKKGLKVKDLILLHIKEDGVKSFEIDYKVYKPLIEKILEHKKNLELV